MLTKDSAKAKVSTTTDGPDTHPPFQTSIGTSGKPNSSNYSASLEPKTTSYPNPWDPGSLTQNDTGIGLWIPPKDTSFIAHRTMITQSMSATPPPARHLPTQSTDTIITSVTFPRRPSLAPFWKNQWIQSTSWESTTTTSTHQIHPNQLQHLSKMPKPK